MRNACLPAMLRSPHARWTFMDDARRKRCEGRSSAKVEVHVEAHGKMIRIVGDVEAHNLLFFIVLALDERKHQTAVSDAVGVFYLERLASAEKNALSSAIAAIGYLRCCGVRPRSSRGIERTGAQHHRNHVKYIHCSAKPPDVRGRCWPHSSLTRHFAFGITVAHHV